MGKALQEPIDPHTAPRSHESSDVAVRPLMIFLAFLVGALALVTIALVALFNTFESVAVRRETALPPLAETDLRAPAPNLQVSPREDMDQFRAREDQVLHSTGWVNQPAGVARIPIEWAMTLTLERGLPNWPAVDPSSSPPEASAERPPLQPQAESPSGTGLATPPPGGEGGNPQ